MFLRMTAALMIVLLPLVGEGALRTSDRYEFTDAETDVKILKSILVRHPGDLKTLQRLIELTFSMENFDQTEKYCEQYLAVEKNSRAAYLKIIAAASLGRFKSAADQVDPFISNYKNELSRSDVELLKYTENLYRKSAVTRAYPSGALKTPWGDDSLIKTFIPRDNLIAGFNLKNYEHTLLGVNGDFSIPAVKYPGYLNEIDLHSVISAALSDDGREVLLSSRSGDSSFIYIRKYLPGKKKWSSWEKYGELNPGHWNHYPNYIDNNTVLFSSSDGNDFDLYIAKRNNNGDWQKAEKLNGVNTPLDEISVYLHPDGETLYFASNGYEGMGGFDIYGAKLTRSGDSSAVSGVKNVTAANTFRNEKYPMFISPSGSAAYFNFRAGTESSVYKCGDIPYKPAPVFFYNAEVVDDSTGYTVKGAFAEYKTTGSDTAIKRPVYSDGFTGATLRRNLKHTLLISAEGYEQFAKLISFTGTDDSVNDIIRLKRKPVKGPSRVYTVLITSLKLYGCDETKALSVHSLLEKNTGLQSDRTRQSKNIFSFTVCGDEDCALRDGKTVNADYAVFGTLSAKKETAMKTLGETGEDQYLAKKVTGTIYTLDLKLLEVASGRVTLSFKKSTENPDALKSITNEFIRKASAELK